MSVSVWEALFMLVVLKIPLVYLLTVVWWAVRAEPRPSDEGDRISVLAPLTPCGWNERRHRRSARPRTRPNLGGALAGARRARTA